LRSKQLKTAKRFIPFILVIFFFLTSCGYHNPYVYSGPDRELYITNWQNRTNDLLLDAKIYQSLVRWYQKSGQLVVTKEKKGADLILAGEIISIDLPSLSYGVNNDATEVKVLLTVRYILKDIKTGEVLIEVPRETWTEEYSVDANSSASSDNEREALAIIIDDLSERIYLKTLTNLSRK
jgi:Lipopolysaccharide-assembly